MFTVNETVGLISLGRRMSYAFPATVTKITPTQIITKDGNGTLRRFRSRDGSPIGATSVYLHKADDPAYTKLRAETKARQEAEAEATAQARAVRIARFNHLLGDSTEFGMLDRIAQRIETLENDIQRRLTSVTPVNLYREIKWLAQCGKDSAELWALTSCLDFVVRTARGADEVPEELRSKSLRELVDHYRAICEERFTNGSDCSQESLDEMFGARAASQFLKWRI